MWRNSPEDQSLQYSLAIAHVLENRCIAITSPFYEFEFEDEGGGIVRDGIRYSVHKIERLVYLSFRRRILRDGCLRRQSVDTACIYLGGQSRP